MKWSMLLLACAMTLACGDKKKPAPEAAAPSESAPGAVDLASEVDDAQAAGMPGKIYRAAYDKAGKEITLDNARDRLRTLERQIDRERQALE